MGTLTVVYWRDIPAQVIAKAGRRTARAELPKRFMEAIDAAAMRAGLFGSDDYLNEWRRGAPGDCGDDLNQAVADKVAALGKEFDGRRLNKLVAGGGKAAPDP